MKKERLIIREDFGETSASSTNWTVDRDVKEVVFALSDASDETTLSGMSRPFNIRWTQTLMYRSTANPWVMIVRSYCC